MEMITKPIIKSVSMDINHAYDKIFMIRDLLVIDEFVVQAQDNGAVAVVYVSPTYCAYHDIYYC